jgi:anti-sigma regulatory factor (Ser/Thr protein kinase)
MPSAADLEALGRARRPPALPRRVREFGAPDSHILPAIPESAGTARRLAGHFLGDQHPAADAVILCVSELVTNAIEHSLSAVPGGTVTVTFCASAREILVQVRDDGGRAAPQVRELGPESEHGRGLQLVAALTDRWGSAAGPEGRVTWCRLPVRQGGPGSVGTSEPTTAVPQNPRPQ